MSYKHNPFVNEKMLEQKKVIGRKIRQLRGERRLTLKETADLCGVSVAHISELERGRISPTVCTMLRVAEGFKKPISFFLPDEYLTTVQVIRSDEQEAIVSNRVTAKMLSARLPGGKLSGSHLILARGETFELQVDSRAERIGIVLKGEIEVILDGERYRLKKEDTFHLMGGSVQQVKNVGWGKAEMVWIRTIATS